MNYADKWTDEKLKLLEKKIFKLFFEAQKDFESLSKEYFENFAERDKEYSKLVESGEITQEEYKQWRLSQLGRGERLDEMAGKMAERATAANEVAVAYVNDLTPSVYSVNRNHEAYVIESLGHEMVGTDFTLYNEAAVRRMVVENPTVMPYYPKEKAVARNIDLAYGQKVIKSKVTSGILQGKSVYEISDDLQRDLATMSRTSAVRAARTAVTSAQNGGKMASMTAAHNMGIKLRKRWVATKDARTRDVHAEADGQTVEIDKPFEVGGEKLMFPSDSSASGWNLYNCRCTMRTVEKDGIEAEPRQMRVRNPETGEWELVSDMSYQEWAESKEKEQKTVANSVQSGTIKSEWDNNLTPRGQLPHIDEDDLYSFVAGELGVSEQKATEYTDAVMAFTDNSGLFTDVRKYQRGETLDEWADMKAVKAISRDAEEYIKVAPRWNAGETFRGVTVSDDELASYTSGSVINMGGMASWSSKMSISEDFSVRNTTYGRPNSAVFHCETQSRGTAIRHLSVLEIEDEVLCSKDAKYKIIRQEKHDDGIIHIFLEEVQ